MNFLRVRASVFLGSYIFVNPVLHDLHAFKGGPNGDPLIAS